MWRRIIFTLALCGIMLIAAMSLPVLGVPGAAPESGSAVQQSPLPTPGLPIPKPLPVVIMSQPNIWSTWLNTSEITVEFEDTVNRQAIAKQLTIEPALKYTLEWQEQTLHIIRKGPLTPDITYHLTIRNVIDHSINSSPAPDFRLALIAPQVVHANSYTSYEQGSEITISFGYRMDGSSVEKALRIEPAAPGILRWSADNSLLTITPDAPLIPNIIYRVYFVGELREQAGYLLPTPESQEFVTQAAIVSSYGSGERINPDQPVHIAFDRAMDWQSVARTLSMHPVLPLDISWQDDTLILLPIQGYFDENRTYTFTVGVNALDADGRPILTEPFTWHVQTENFRSSNMLGYGPHLQIVNAGGRRAIQYKIEQDSAYIPVTLYKLSAARFLEHYISTINGEVGWTDLPMSTAPLPIVAEWREEPLPSSEQSSDPFWPELLLPNDIAAGFYLLQLGAELRGEQMIVILTHNVIALKRDAKQISGWVTDIDGGSVANAAITMYTVDGAIAAQSQSNVDGLFQMPVASETPLILFAQVGEDTTAVGLASAWRSHDGQWPFWWRPLPRARAYAVHIVTDRPLYRPGDTLYFKAIIRQDDDGILSMPQLGANCVVTIRDGENRIQQSQEVRIYDMGAISGAFLLDSESTVDAFTTGDYTLEVSVDGEIHRQLFGIEEKPAPEIDVTIQTLDKAGAPSNHFSKGDLITLAVNVRTQSGDPVANQRVEIQSYFARSTSVQLDSNAVFGWYPKPRVIVGRTDANGYFTTTVAASGAGNPIPISQESPSLRYDWVAFQAIVEDDARQTVHALTGIQVDNGEEIITLEPMGRIQQVGQPFPIHITVKTLTGEAVAQRVLNLVLVRQVFDDPNNAGGEEVQRLQLKSDDAGEILTQLRVDDAGYYELRAVARAPLLYEVRASSWLWVAGDKAAWPLRAGTQLHIVPDRDEYMVGDVARFAIESQMSGPALLTFERGRTRRAEVIELTAPLTIIEREIQAGDAPNSFVSVSAWLPGTERSIPKHLLTSLSDAVLVSDQAEIAVAVAHKQLTIIIQPDQRRYAPGSHAAFDIQVIDSNGVPTAAELAIALVDADTLMLGPELSPSIYRTFYGKRPHLVESYDGLALTRWFYGIDGGGESPPINLHSLGAETLLWLPIKRTDINGSINVSVNLPNRAANLRLTVVATTGSDTLVGEASIPIGIQ